MGFGSGGGGVAGAAELRRLLGRAAEDDDERSGALGALCERSVFAATWGGSGASLRILTNGDGEKAMPLFTGSDTLRAAAQRFGWSSEDGGEGMRELGAREAMQSALAQGVQFIVVDVGADHCVEFARDEVALMLAAKQARQRPAPIPSVRSPSPAGGRTQLEAMPPRRPPSVASMPAAAARTTPGVAFDALSPPPFRPPSLTPPALGSASSLPPRVPADKPARADATLPQLMTPLPMASPVDAAVGIGFGLADEQPEARPAALEAAAVVAEVAKMTKDGATQRAAAEVTAMLKQMALKGVDEANKPLKSAAKAFASLLGGELNASVEKRTGSQSKLDAAPAAAEPAPAADKEGAPQRSAGDVTSMLKQMALKGVDEANKPLKSAAKAFASLLGGESSAGAEKRASHPSKVEAAPAAAEPVPADESAPETANEVPAEPEYAEGALRPLHDGLGDPAQAAIGEALRAYPEVEWACEVSDGTETPVVGVRVSPSFMNRAAEIEAAVLKAAKARQIAVRVLLLTEPALMREARTHGNTFFPWRKRPARKS